MARYLIATALFSVLAASPALASFTLIAPEPTAPGETSITAIPLAPQAQTQTAPVAAQPVAPPAPQMQMQMVAPAPKTMLAPTVAATPATMTTPSSLDTPVRGFGKDIPLIIAAQQIAPDDRQIAFGNGVDPSMPISWEGGKTWRNVLSAALSSRGLQMAEQGNILFITRGNSTLAPTNASLLMEPKYMREEQTSTPTMTAPAQQPGYLPPTAPAPVANAAIAPTAPNTYALPNMVMPPAAPVNDNMMAQPSPTNPVVLPPQGSPITPNMAAAPAQPYNSAETVIPPQQPIGYQQMPVPAMKSSIVTVPLTPQPIPVMPTEPVTQNASMVMPPVAPAGDAAITSGTWEANSNQTLKQVFEDWSARANTTLRWDSEFDYPVQSNVNFQGDFEAAVRGLLRGFSSAQPQPIARLYRPSEGAPGVLLVTTRGNDVSMGQ